MRVELMVVYDRASDRLLGGDSTRSMNGVELRAVLTSMEHAQLLQPLCSELSDKSSTLVPRPFPGVLAVISVPGLPVVIDGEQCLVEVAELLCHQLLEAPPAYCELAQVLLTQPSTSTLAEQEFVSAVEATAFARTLFGALHLAHVVGATFANAYGTCLTPDSVTTAGEIRDPYYLCRPDALHENHRRGDLIQGLQLLLWNACPEGVDAAEPLEAAIDAYTAGFDPAVRRPSTRTVGTSPTEDAIEALASGLCRLGPSSQGGSG